MITFLFIKVVIVFAHILNVKMSNDFVRIIKLLRASIKISKKRRKLRKNRYNKKYGKQNKKKNSNGEIFEEPFFLVFLVLVFEVKLIQSD
jgi:hypothetical protein